MMNYLYDKLLEVCAAKNTSPNAWALASNLSTGTPTQLKHGVRPSMQTLNKLVYAWGDDKIAAEIFIAYLKDEIERMGFTLDTIEPLLKGATFTPTLDEDLKTVADFMAHAPIRESIHKFAMLLRQSEWAKQKDSQALIAEAEELALMQRARRKKKNTKTA